MAISLTRTSRCCSKRDFPVGWGPFGVVEARGWAILLWRWCTARGFGSGRRNFSWEMAILDGSYDTINADFLRAYVQVRWYTILRYSFCNACQLKSCLVISALANS